MTLRKSTVPCIPHPNYCRVSSWSISLRLILCICITIASLTAIRTASAATFCSTPGKDLVGSLAGVVNTYYPVTTSVSAGATSITLGSSAGASTGISAGDLLLVIQMQDADINYTNTSAYGNGLTGAGYTSINQASLYEYIKATNTVGTGGGTVNLSTGTVNSYRYRTASGTRGASTFQVIRVPQYSTATITASGVSAYSWDGLKGGIVAIDVAGDLTISGDINVSGQGFRGGWGETGGSLTSANYTYYYTSNASTHNGYKGEGIAGTPHEMNKPANYNGSPTTSITGVLGYPNGTNATAAKGRGAPGNAGGGGTDGLDDNSENSGGGGGGNYGPGGKGGNSWNSNRTIGGEGGGSVPVAFNKIVLGGGGGAGSTNDGTGDGYTGYTNPAGIPCSATNGSCSSGAPGGGIVIVRAQKVSGSGTIFARGGNAYNTSNDSAGGGGAGGTVIIETQIAGNATADVSGGNGGNAWRNHSSSDADRHGPGGGGSGGFIAYAPSTLALAATYPGGINGITTNESSYGSSGSIGGTYAYQVPNAPGSGTGYNCRPKLSKAYSATSIGVGASSTLTFTITNSSGNPAQSALAFTDTFPAGLTATAVGTISGTGCSGTPAFTASTVSLAAGAITAGNSTCTFTATVRGDTAATYVNDSTRFSSIGGLLDASATTATLNVYTPPTITKAFGAATIAVGGSTTLTLTLGNPAANVAAITGVQLDDTFPAGLTLQNTTFTFAPLACGTVTKISGAASAAGDNNVRFLAASIASGASCQVNVNVASSTTGAASNTTNAPTAAGPVALTGTAASATINVYAPPTITKAFGAAGIAIGGSTTLALTLGNPAANVAAITTNQVDDTFPAGLALQNTTFTFTPAACGTVTKTSGAASAAGDNNIRFSSATIPQGTTCQASVNVTSSTAGAASNTTNAPSAAGPIALTGSTANAMLNVYAPPTATKAITSPFNSGTTTTMTLTVANPLANPAAITAQTDDTFPAGLTLQNTTFTFTPAACGTVTKTTGAVSAAGDNNVRLTAAALAANSSCQVQLNVTSSTPGTTTNTTNAPVGTAPVAATGTAASAAYTVMATPTVAKAFGVANLASGGNTNLTVTIGNTNAGAITLTSLFTDTFPGGMTINTAGNTGTCGGVTAAAAATSFTIASGTSIPSGGCTVIVNVKSSTAGAATNTIAANALQTAAGNNAALASAVLNVYAPLTVSKAFGAISIPSGGSTTLTLTLANPAANVAALTGVQVDDAFPAGLTLQNTTFTFAPAACGTVTKTSGAASAAGDNNVRFSAASIAPGATCKVSVNVTSSTAGSITNTTNAPTATGPAALTGSSANAPLTVYALPLISILKSADRANANPGQVVIYTVQIVNTGAGVGTSVVLTDDLSPYGSFYLGAGAPFTFTDSSPISGLSLGAPQYSNNNGTTWGVYFPVSGGGGAPAGYDGNVTNWRIPMTGTIRAGGSFILNYQIVVK